MRTPSGLSNFLTTASRVWWWFGVISDEWIRRTLNDDILRVKTQNNITFKRQRHVT